MLHHRRAGVSGSLGCWAVLTFLAPAAGQAPSIDGAISGDESLYGPVLWVQNQPTNLGDNTNPHPDFANGSEINKAYGYSSATDPKKDEEKYSYLIIVIVLGTPDDDEGQAGPGPRLDLFFDVAPGGQNTLRGDNVRIDSNGLNRMGAFGGDLGLTFEPDFAADYWVSFTNFRNNNGTPGMPGDDFAEVFAFASTLRTNGPVRLANGNPRDYGAFDGGPKSLFNPIPFEGPLIDIQDGSKPNLFTNYGPRLAFQDPLNPVPRVIEVTINNGVTNGVTGSSAAGAATAVSLGLEICLCFAEMGVPDDIDYIKVAGFLNAPDHGSISNQVLGGLPNATPLGEPRTTDFGAIPGTQYITVSAEQVCLGDFDRNTLLNTSDILQFLNAFQAADLRADMDRGGFLNTSDVLQFLNFYNAGCP